MLLGYLRLELRRTVRDSGFLIMSLIAPVALYLLFSHLGGGPSSHDEQVRNMAGMAGFGALGAVMNSLGGVSEDKRAGWLRQLRLTPLPPVTVVLGRAITSMTLALPPVLAVTLLGGLVNGVHLSAAEWVGTVGVLWVGIAPISMLAIGCGYLLDGAKAQSMGLVSYLLLSVVGGLLIDVKNFPHWLGQVSGWTPINRYKQLVSDLALGHALSTTALAILLVWSVALAVFAAFGYRRGTTA
ncbi:MULTISPECIES: ABC transporter permease [unclassified Streptomyces]|uniref:ABC transporter permease n=1 Tax=unclassified Streptomyces TaxID=2593676 RepID=UPI0011A9195C|nr:ABC transporter permease [Streptomyces sp. BK340]TVZ80486.1 ABC-2 type transport system permease protein [Streptomyces sp. BK340]